MRLSLLSVSLLLLTFGAAGAAESAPDKADEVDPHNNVGRMPGGLVIRAFSFDLVEAKKDYDVITIYFSDTHSRKLQHTIALRQGAYFPNTKEYEVVSITSRSATIGNPDTEQAAIIVTDAIVRHRDSGATYRLRDDGGTKLVERVRKT